jgi:hypothetical protein
MSNARVWKVRYVEDSKVDPKVWEEIPPLVIDNFPWDENGYRPRTEVRIFYSETRFYLLFKAFEQEIRAECLNINDPVCTDSCVEFFFNPDPEHDDRYINFEINPIGTFLLGIGADRYSRVLINDVSPEIFDITTSVTKDSVQSYKGPLWTAEYSIPFYFIEKYYGRQDFRCGKRIKANFYKCGDKTKYPHWGCWNRIDTPHPDFHRPEFFGELILG